MAEDPPLRKSYHHVTGCGNKKQGIFGAHPPQDRKGRILWRKISS